MRKCIIVLGMHRSGTSAMAGLLKISGVYLGDNLLGKTDGNVKGHFENINLFKLNEELLKSIGSSWEDLEKIDYSKFERNESKKIIRRIENTLLKEFVGKSLFCIKDPRISLLIPIYRRIFKKLKVKPYFIVMNRNFFEISKSLEKRDGFSDEKSKLLCQKYYDSIRFDNSNIDKIDIEFDDLLRKTRDCYDSISKKFNISLGSFSKIRAEVNSFLIPKLKNHNIDKIVEKKDLQIKSLNSQNVENLNIIEIMGSELDYLKNKLANIENSITWRSVKKLDWITKPLLFDTGIISNNFGVEEYSVSMSDLKNIRIAVVAHVYYEEMWEEIEDYINNIPINFDLYVNLVEGHSNEIRNRILDKYPECRLTVSKNKGYDFGGLIKSLEIMDLKKYDLICKVHTKKAGYRDDGDIWRAKLLDSILGSTKKISGILRGFNINKKLGIVGAKEFLNRESMGGNSEFYSYFCDKLNIPFRKRGLNFVAGSIFWCRADIIGDIKKLKLNIEDFENPNRLDGQKAHAIERIFGAIANNRGYKIEGVESGYHLRNRVVSLHNNQRNDNIRPICFYFPQYHVIPENEKWWGNGFTEWNNVMKGKPLFKGHDQPKIPGELGYYNLKELDIAERQAKLARDNGIYGFCYYYYWFNGKKLLNAPIERMLKEKKPDFPFCVCWANENWTRVWDGKEDDIIMKQEFSKEDCKNFINEMSSYFEDERYIKINGNPLLVIYRIDNVPNPKEFLSLLRKYAMQKGFNIHLSLVQSFSKEDPTSLGFDSAIEFPPSKPEIGSSKKNVKNLSSDFNGEIFDYKEVFEKYSKKPRQDYTLFFGTTPGWDNSARRKNDPVVLINSNPNNYKKWLEHVIVKTKHCYKGDERLVFINAWNEWGEGCYLEPDKKYGHSFLKATKEILDKYRIIR